MSKRSLSDQYSSARHLANCLAQLREELVSPLPDGGSSFDTEYAFQAIEVVRFCRTLTRDLLDRGETLSDSASMIMLALECGDGQLASAWLERDQKNFGPESPDARREFIDVVREQAERLVLELKELIAVVSSE
jgi:hypothetical protein